MVSRRRWAGLGVVVAVAAATAPVAVGETVAPLVFDAPVLVSESQAARETSLALNPADPDDRFICEPSGVPATGNGHSYYHHSTDGGRSWKAITVETSATDTRKAAFEGGDCDVIYDAAGTMYAADTWLGNLSVGASRDGGTTWEGTALAVSSPVVDRPWLTGGPAGTVYLSYHALQCCMPSAMWFTKTTDYGKTWAPAVPITTANADGAYVWEGNLVASPDGRTLHVVYTRRQESGVVSTGALGRGETVWVAQSTDGGSTWTQHKVATMPGSASYLYPSIARDAGGLLHVVFASARTEDQPIWYTTSRDGRTWTAVEPISGGTAGVSPWIDGGAAGEAVIAWLGSTDPKATGSTMSPWYFYAARVTGAGTTAQQVVWNRTTPKPLFTGRQTTPEFEMVRRGPDGRMHLGMSVFKAAGRWAAYYQAEALPTP